MRYLFTPIRIVLPKKKKSPQPKTGKPENSKCWRRCGEFGILVHCCWEQMMQLLYSSITVE